jgi:hypothetical protein
VEGERRGIVNKEDGETKKGRTRRESQMEIDGAKMGAGE